MTASKSCSAHLGKIIVGPLNAFPSVVETYQPSRILSTVAIDQVPQTPEYMKAENHLISTFNDISTEIKGLKAAGIQDIQQLLKFAENWDGRKPLFIHCWMGVSRSTASALAIACHLQPQKSERDVALQLRKVAPSATPNKRIIDFCDQIMKRNGRLVEAVEFIGRGASASIGRVFELDLKS